MSVLLPFRRRSLPWLLSALTGVLLLLVVYEQLEPRRQRMQLRAPAALPDSLQRNWSDRAADDQRSRQHTGPVSQPDVQNAQPPPDRAGSSEPAEPDTQPSQAERQSSTEAPVYSQARSTGDNAMRKFQVSDNPAYQPGLELEGSAGGSAFTQPVSVTDLLLKGASHLLSQVSTSNRRGDDTTSPRRDPQPGQAKSTAEPEVHRFTPPHQLLLHLDLKGAPPSVAFLRDVIALAAGLGATGLLIEWEDKFPFWGALKPVAAGNAYTMEQVRAIVGAAHAHNLTVMPLVQTFGHVEFVLKLPQFAHLREDPSTPQALCPSRNGSMELVQLMLDQVMTAHPGASRVHIGADEVFVLGRCDLCRRRLRDDLLLGHIARTARYVRRRYNATAVLWEDMLRNAATSRLRQHGVDELVEPMMWWYTPNVRKYVAPQVWRHAERVYSHVWGAGAYKGGFGSALFAPPIDRHVQNNLDWTELLAEEDGRMSGGVRGLVLTGWSRYDHFATLPELLAAAVPSLAFSLAAVRRGALDQEAAEAAQRALGCTAPAPLSSLDWPFVYRRTASCRFPGQRVYQLMERYNKTAVSVRRYLALFETGQQSAWLGRYNARHGFTSVLKVREELPVLQRHQRAAAGLLAPLFRSLRQIYDADLVLEWLEQRVFPLLEDLDRLKQRMEALGDGRQYPVRPLRGYSEDFLRYMDAFADGWRSSR